MQSVFEKIKERLEESGKEIYREPTVKDPSGCSLIPTGEKDLLVSKAIEIVNQVAEEYNDGWIPYNEKKPDEDRQCFITYEWEDGTLHVCEDYFTAHGWEDIMTSAVIAWKYVDFPAPYQPKGE